MAKKQKPGKKKNHAVAAVLAVAAAACLIGLFAYGLGAVRLGTEDAEANGLSAAVTSDSMTAEERAAMEKAAAEKAAREAAEKEAAEKAAKEKAAKDAEEAARQALIKAHPELGSEITYQLPTGDVTLDMDTLKTWMVDNGDGTYTKDDTKWADSISAYVADMAAKVDTLGKPRTFNATGIGPVQVDGSQYYGWEINQDAEVSQLTSELASGTKTTREPVYSSRESAKADDNNGIGQNYCEIDASRQHLWIYQNGQLAFETDVVTGLMDKAHYTPGGIYLIFRKETDATLKGEQLPNGKRTYETPVSYWMPFTDTGIGLHDAWWKSVFGAGQNVWNGSHGCVNLPADVAGTVYDLMTTQTPIVIYYSEGCDLREAPPSEVDKYLAEQEAAAKQAEAEKQAQEQAAAEEKAQQEAAQAAQQQAAEEAARQQAAQQQAAEEAARQQAEQAAQQQAAEEAARQQAEQAAQQQAAVQQS